MDPEIRAKQKAAEYALSIITGGSSGIGKSLIEQLTNLRPAPRICNISRRIPASFLIGPNALHLEANLADRAQRNEIVKRLGSILQSTPSNQPILLVNNAGFGTYGPIAEQSPDTHQALIEVNLAAVVELTTRLLPDIKERGGAIVNIASTTAFQATPWMATYGAAKAFVLHWSLALNEELKGSKARCLAVCPGPTRTEFFQRAGIDGTASQGGFSMSSDRVAAAILKALEKAPNARFSSGACGGGATTAASSAIRARTYRDPHAQ